MCFCGFAGAQPPLSMQQQQRCGEINKNARYSSSFTVPSKHGAKIFTICAIWPLKIFSGSIRSSSESAVEAAISIPLIRDEFLPWIQLTQHTDPLLQGSGQNTAAFQPCQSCQSCQSCQFCQHCQSCLHNCALGCCTLCCNPI